MIGCVYAILKYSLEIVDFVVAVDRSSECFFFFNVALVLLAFFLEIRRGILRSKENKNCLSTTKIQAGKNTKWEREREPERHHAIHVWNESVRHMKLLLLLHFQLNLNKVNELQSNVLLNILDYTLCPDSTLLNISNREPLMNKIKWKGKITTTTTSDSI